MNIDHACILAITLILLTPRMGWAAEPEIVDWGWDFREPVTMEWSVVTRRGRVLELTLDRRGVDCDIEYVTVGRVDEPNPTLPLPNQGFTGAWLESEMRFARNFGSGQRWMWGIGGIGWHGGMVFERADYRGRGHQTATRTDFSQEIARVCLPLDRTAANLGMQNLGHRQDRRIAVDILLEATMLTGRIQLHDPERLLADRKDCIRRTDCDDFWIWLAGSTPVLTELAEEGRLGERGRTIPE